jgi:endonuclease/exonuclease/phosphatase family metal-dependent hydrolase
MNQGEKFEMATLKLRYLRLLVALGLVLGATVTAPGLSQTAYASREPHQITILTRNMDAGTRFGPVLAAHTFPEFLAGVAELYAEVQASNPPERAAGVAQEIAAAQPDLVALQEVSQWRTGPLFGNPTTVVYDVLASLLAELDKQGLHYTPVAVIPEWTISAPCACGFSVGYSDYEVILARTDLPPVDFRVDNMQVGHFTHLLTVPSVVGPVTIPHGWASVDVHIPGKTFRFITTHLEAESPSVQSAQGAELLVGPGNTTLPTIYAGDFNSAAVGGPDQTPTYSNLIMAGLVDLWSAANPGDSGLTWPLHGEDPYTQNTPPTERIDLVLGKGRVEAVNAQRIGTDVLTPSGLWPSDHAGVVVTVRIR